MNNKREKVSGSLVSEGGVTRLSLSLVAFALNLREIGLSRRGGGVPAERH